jgi:hypothetical protein
MEKIRIRDKHPRFATLLKDASPLINVAGLDPGSDAFLTPDPGSEIGFFF